jgi:hypothetical protein
MPHAGDKPKGGGSPPPDNGQMGMQFTPATADTTASMLAGKKALQSLAETDQLPASSSTPKPSRGTPRNGEVGQKFNSGQALQPRSGSQQTTQPTAATDKSAQSTSGQQSPEGQMANSSADSKLGERTFHEEPWVAKLPPELRQAIRAQSQRPPPRGYEGRLRRYFENVD